MATIILQIMELLVDLVFYLRDLHLKATFLRPNIKLVASVWCMLDHYSKISKI